MEKSKKLEESKTVSEDHRESRRSQLQNICNMQSTAKRRRHIFGRETELLGIMHPARSFRNSSHLLRGEGEVPVEILRQILQWQSQPAPSLPLKVDYLHVSPIREDEKRPPLQNRVTF